MYGTLDLTARYLFTTGRMRPWLGFGIGLLFPVTKSSTALSASSIGTTNVMQFQGGLDFAVGQTMYVPISVEYGLLPKSDQVDAHWIALRVGLALPF
jgi:outer membrane protein W